MAREELEPGQSNSSRADTDNLMGAMIGACAFIAHADGVVDPKERKRVLHLMRALPIFSSFTNEAVLEAFAAQERAFEVEPERARAAVLTAVTALRQHHGDVRLLLSACQTVLEADGVYHPNEYKALGEIGRALGPIG